MYQLPQPKGYLRIASQPALLPGIDVPIHSGINGNGREQVSTFNSKYKYFRLRSVVWQD